MTHQDLAARWQLMRDQGSCLPFKKIISRFNVHIFFFQKKIHMFLTRGTYSIKVSYWINDAH